MKSSLKCMLSVAVAAATAVSLASDRNWTGNGADGKWSTTANWSGGKPLDNNYDNVRLNGTNLVDGTIENDIGKMKLYSLQFRENAPVVFNSPYLISVFTPGNAFHCIVPSLVYNGDLRLDANTARTATFYITSDLELNGNLEIADEMLLNFSTYYEGKTMAINGSVAGTNATLKMAIYQKSRVDFNGKVDVARFVSAIVDRPGAPHFNVSGNEIGEFVQGYNRTYLDAENALSTNTVISWDDSCRENHLGRIHLTGSQHANRIDHEFLDLSKYANADRIQGNESDLDAPVTLTLYGTADAVAMARIDNNVSVVWNPSGDYTQEFRDRVHHTKGSLVVSNGTLKIGGVGTFYNARKVVAAGGVFEVASSEPALEGLETLEVGDGGRFRVSTDANPLTARQTDVTVDGSGVVEIPSGMVLAVKSVTVDGEPLPSGFYARKGNQTAVTEVSATEVEWIEGDGVVLMSRSVPTVETTEAVWDGEAQDDLASSAANWDGDAVPDFAAGGLVAKFATAGDSAMFAQGGVLKGIVFDTENDFAVTAGKTLHLRQSGIVVADKPQDDAKRVYVLNGPVQLDCSQTWQTTNATTLKISGPLSHYFVSETLTFTGHASGMSNEDGIFEMTGDNVIAGKIELKKSRLQLCGSGGKPAELNGNGGALQLMGELYGSLMLSNAVIRKPVEFRGGDIHRRIVLYGGTTNIIAGKMTLSWTPRFYVNHKGVLINEGGVSANDTWICPSGAGKLSLWRIREKPLVSEGVMELSGITMSLEAPGNEYQLARIGNNARIAFGCDYAISNSSVNVRFVHSSSEIDLGGYDQLTGEIAVSSGVDGAKITSATPAVFGFTQNTNLTLSALDITGAASLAKYGSATVTLDRAVSSTGGLTVGEGVFAFGPGGSWLNASNVVVNGTGKLILPSSEIFKRKHTVASVDTSEGACIELPDGVHLRLASLSVDGKELPYGTYGGASAPEGVLRSAAFSASGSGSVTVGTPNFSIIVR